MAGHVAAKGSLSIRNIKNGKDYGSLDKTRGMYWIDFRLK